MLYRFMADLVVLLHFGTVVFVVLGGLLVVFWRRVAWLHLPVVAWVVFAECLQRICPLTYLEDWLRDRAGVERYHGGFVAHYIMPVLYPEGLTPRVQVGLGVIVFAINLALYVIAFRRRPSRAQASNSS